MPKLVISCVIFWPLFGHFCTPIGHILDIFLVWTCFGNILVTYWSLFGLILANMSKMCPYTHSQAVPSFHALRWETSIKRWSRNKLRISYKSSSESASLTHAHPIPRCIARVAQTESQTQTPFPRGIFCVSDAIPLAEKESCVSVCVRGINLRLHLSVCPSNLLLAS